MRQRNFEIIRKPDLEDSSFLFNSVRVKLVPWHGQDVHPETGSAFYINSGKGGVIGVRVYPDGRKVAVNPGYAKLAPRNKRSKKEGYLQFSDAWGCHNYILASHAVYIAWRGPIEEGMTIDHIDGCSTNNDYRNLRCVSNDINNRDGGFLRKLRNKGIKLTTIPRWMLLRYFLRMANIKTIVTSYRYKHLTKNDLMLIIFNTDSQISNHFLKLYNIKITFNYAK